MSRRRLDGTAVAVVALTIAAVSLVPLSGGDPTFGPFGVGLDKWFHGVGYATFAVTVALTLRAHPHALGLAVLSATGYGLAIEGIQTPLPYRTGSVADAVANAAGAVVGASSVWVVRVIERNR